jgi:hypothetical protein
MNGTRQARPRRHFMIDVLVRFMWPVWALIASSWRVGAMVQRVEYQVIPREHFRSNIRNGQARKLTTIVVFVALIAVAMTALVVPSKTFAQFEAREATWQVVDVRGNALAEIQSSMHGGIAAIHNARLPEDSDGGQDDESERHFLSEPLSVFLSLVLFGAGLGLVGHCVNESGSRPGYATAILILSWCIIFAAAAVFISGVLERHTHYHYSENYLGLRSSKTQVVYETGPDKYQTNHGNYSGAASYFMEPLRNTNLSLPEVLLFAAVLIFGGGWWSGRGLERDSGFAHVTGWFVMAAGLYIFLITIIPILAKAVPR